MKRYKLDWCHDILLPNSFEKYSKFLINYILEKYTSGPCRGQLRLGHYMFNDLFEYRIVNPKKRSYI